MAILALMAYGCMNFIKTDVQLLKMFDSNATIINHYEWLENNLGELIPVELVVKVAPEKQLATNSMHDDPAAAIDKMLLVERIDIANHVNRVLKDCFRHPGEERIGQTMAAPTFVPDWNMDDYTVGSSRYRAHQTHVSKTLEAPTR